MHPMVLIGDVGQVELRFSPFRCRVNPAQDRCTVCAECTTGMEIIWAHPMVLLGDVCQVKAHFSSFGDSVNLGVS
jgi:hypothetical protein